MLPKDITNIIAGYNEIGIFIHDSRQLYWFNGKRFECWCKDTRSDNIMTYGGNLYILSYHTIYMYKNKTFIKIEVPQRWNHPLCVFRDSKTLVDGKVYDHHCDTITNEFNNSITLPRKNYPKYGFQLLSYNDCLYYFGSKHNEKFINGKWIEIAKYPYPELYHCYRIYLFNNKFYAFRDASDYHIYDPELDDWESKIIIN